MKILFQILTYLCVLAVMILTFTVPIPESPGLGQMARIIFLHVPTAWLSVLAFLLSMIYSVQYLVKKDIVYDIKAYSASGIGFLFCILATVTGSLWAKFMWGSFWNWDPRETSIFILLLIYGAYFSLRSAIENREQKAKLSSVYAIIAFVTVPFFIFILPRIVQTLHPDPLINTTGKINMDSSMLRVFLFSLFSFTLLFVQILNLKIRLEKLYFINQNKEN